MSKKPSLTKCQKLESYLKEKNEETKRLSGMYLKVSDEAEVLRNKVSHYMQAASMQKEENEDLTAKTKQLEDTIRTQNKSLVAVKSLLKDQEEEIKKLERDRKDFFNASSNATKEIDRLNDEIIHLRNKNKQLCDQLFAEKNKTWWQKFKEGFIRG